MGQPGDRLHGVRWTGLWGCRCPGRCSGTGGPGLAGRGSLSSGSEEQSRNVKMGLGDRAECHPDKVLERGSDLCKLSSGGVLRRCPEADPEMCRQGVY